MKSARHADDARGLVCGSSRVWRGVFPPARDLGLSVGPESLITHVALDIRSLTVTRVAFSRFCGSLARMHSMLSLLSASPRGPLTMPISTDS